MIETVVRAEIMHRLQQTEQQEDVRILMAIESGSRAWGFASPNSDYDVRFIYVRPKDWYVAVDFEEKRDVIEYPIVDEIDLSGWDVRKALRLFWKSNPSFVEWLRSPISYIDQGCFKTKACERLPHVYSIEKGIHHYLSMVKNNYRTYLKTDYVPLKKYFYVLRPLLAIRWLTRYQSVAPIEFHRLLSVLDDVPVLAAIEDLLAQKKVSTEKTLIPAVAVIQHFIEGELSHLEKATVPKWHSTGEIAILNELFHRVLSEQENMKS